MSDWKQGAAKRRDERHTHGDPQAGKHRSKKDRRRWCGGKPGVEHEFLWRGLGDEKYSGRPALAKTLNIWEIKVCQKCGKNDGMRRRAKS